MQKTTKAMTPSKRLRQNLQRLKKLTTKAYRGVQHLSKSKKRRKLWDDYTKGVQNEQLFIFTPCFPPCKIAPQDLRKKGRMGAEMRWDFAVAFNGIHLEPSEMTATVTAMPYISKIVDDDNVAHILHRSAMNALTLTSTNMSIDEFRLKLNQLNALLASHAEQEMDEIYAATNTYLQQIFSLNIEQAQLDWDAQLAKAQSAFDKMLAPFMAQEYALKVAKNAARDTFMTAEKQAKTEAEKQQVIQLWENARATQKEYQAMVNNNLYLADAIKRDCVTVPSQFLYSISTELR